MGGGGEGMYVCCEWVCMRVVAVVSECDSILTCIGRCVCGSGVCGAEGLSLTIYQFTILTYLTYYCRSYECLFIIGDLCLCILMTILFYSIVIN